MSRDTAGVFPLTYRQDLALIRTGKQWICLILFFVVLAAGPLILSDRLLAVLNITLITAVAVVGLQINLGYAGQINLGQAAFMGVGAYAGALLSVRFNLSFLLVIPLSGLVAAASGYLFGLVAARIRGFYLALTTVAAHYFFHFAIISLPASWLGGAKGLSVPPAELFGFKFTGEGSLFLLNLVVLILMVYGAFGLVRSHYGRDFIAVRDDDAAAGVMGVDVVTTKVKAFLVGSFYAGVAGALWGYYLRYISVDQFGLFNSIWMIAMIILGGMGSIVGALVGVVVVRSIQEAITSLAPVAMTAFPNLGGEIVFASYNMILGVMIAASLLFEPKGLMHRWGILKSSYRIWPYPY
ncbi:MAG: branched-chain amino acid ABC transporter permease [Bradyrhizobium sp.]